jgi:hypothetical protein
MQDRVKSPYELVPTESLRFQLMTIDEPVAPMIQVQSVSSVSNKQKTMVSRELDEESGKKILDYIYDEMNGSLISKKKKRKPLAKPGIADNGHKNAFYIPEQKTINSSGTTSTSLFDRISDSLGLKTTSNVAKIDLDTLVNNEMTLEILIEDCEIPISNLRQANIVSTFQDLLALGFTPMDLTRDRKLFNVGTLKTLFDADYKTMRKYNVPIDIEHIMKGKFVASELQTIGFTFEYMIQEKGIGRSQLHALNFSLSDLINLGLENQHLRILDISKRRALSPRPDGFGWDKETYELLKMT